MLAALLDRASSLGSAIGSRVTGNAFGGGATGASAFSTILDSQPRFAVVGTGPFASRSIVPQTRAAQDLLASPAGERVSQAMRGVLALADKRVGTVTLNGFAFSGNRAGYAANILAAETPTEQHAELRRELANPRDLSRVLGSLAGELEGALAVYSKGWITLDDAQSTALAQGRAGRDLLTTLRHELEHAVSTPTDAEGRTLRGLEESIAETLAQWPGAVEELSTAMRIPVPRDTAGLAYAEGVGTLGALLGRAGIDPTNPAQRREAEQLLQGRPLAQVPAAIAARIAQREGLASDAIKELDSSISFTFGVM